VEQPPKRLLDQVRDAIRLKHCSIRTEESYAAWIRRCILFHDERHLNESGLRPLDVAATLAPRVTRLRRRLATPPLDSLRNPRPFPHLPSSPKRGILRP
jgi:hypothetical protein